MLAIICFAIFLHLFISIYSIIIVIIVLVLIIYTIILLNSVERMSIHAKFLFFFFRFRRADTGSPDSKRFPNSLVYFLLLSRIKTHKFLIPATCRQKKQNEFIFTIIRRFIPLISLSHLCICVSVCVHECVC